MAIKITAAGAIPAVDLDHVHFDRFNMAITRGVPAKTAITGHIALYGEDVSGNKFFEAKEYDLSIPHLEAFVGGLDPADQVEAMQALAKVSEGLGVLAEKYFGWNFEAVE